MKKIVCLGISMLFADLCSMECVDNPDANRDSRRNRVVCTNTASGVHTFDEAGTLHCAPVDILCCSKLSVNGCKLHDIKDSITSVIVHEGVKTIDECCFKGWNRLQHVQLGEGLETIGIEAFMYTGLTDILIPSSVKTIQDSCFESRSLKKIRFADNAELLSICHGAFSKTKIYTISIPANVSTIESYAFYGCDLLKIIQFHDDSHLEVIEERAFGKCPLVAVHLPDSVRELHRWCFGTFNRYDGIAAYGDEIEFYFEVNPTSRLERIEGGVFTFGIKANQLNIPSNILQRLGIRINEHIYMKPEGLCICASIFTGQQQLKELIIPNQIVKLCDGCFDGWSSLQKITFQQPAIVKEFGNYAFAGVQCLRNGNFLIPASVEKIGQYCFISGYRIIFAAGSKLQFIDVQDAPYFGPYVSCRRYGEHTQYEGCLGDIYGLYYCMLSSDYKHSIIFVQDINVRDVLLKCFAEYKCAPRILVEGDLFFKGMHKDDFEPIQHDMTSFPGIDVIPEQHKVCVHGVDIPPKAFCGATNIKRLVFDTDYDITNIIEEYAFANTGIDWISIPANISEIRAYAFYRYCPGHKLLSCLYIDQDSRLSYIGVAAFAFSCIRTLVVPGTVETIDDYAFYRGYICELIFDSNASLTRIGKYAFADNMLVDLCVPSCVQRIEEGAFSDVHLAVSYPSGKIESLALLQRLIFMASSSLEYIGDCAFLNHALMSLEIPDSVKHMGVLCFATLKQGVLQNIKVGEGSQLEEVLWRVFPDYIEPRHVCIPEAIRENVLHMSDKVTYIETKDGKAICPNIINMKDNAGWCKKIKIPAKIEVVLPGTFAFCTASDIQFAEKSKLRVIGDYAFYMSCFQDVRIPASVKQIGKNCFWSKQPFSIYIEPLSQLRMIGMNAIVRHSMTVKNDSVMLNGKVSENIFQEADGVDVYVYNKEVYQALIESCKAWYSAPSIVLVLESDGISVVILQKMRHESRKYSAR